MNFEHCRIHFVEESAVKTEVRKILILNESPRAPRSNSKRYAGLFARYSSRPTDYAEIRRNNHAQLAARMAEYRNVVLVFPLYADALPVTLLDFLKSLETTASAHRPTI